MEAKNGIIKPLCSFSVRPAAAAVILYFSISLFHLFNLFQTLRNLLAHILVSDSSYLWVALSPQILTRAFSSVLHCSFSIGCPGWYICCSKMATFVAVFVVIIMVIMWCNDASTSISLHVVSPHEQRWNLVPQSGQRTVETKWLHVVLHVVPAVDKTFLVICSFWKFYSKDWFPHWDT